MECEHECRTFIKNWRKELTIEDSAVFIPTKCEECGMKGEEVFQFVNFLTENGEIIER